MTFDELIDDVAAMQVFDEGLLPEPAGDEVRVHSVEDLLRVLAEHGVFPSDDVPPGCRATLFGMPVVTDSDVPVGQFRLTGRRKIAMRGTSNMRPAGFLDAPKRSTR